MRIIIFLICLLISIPTYAQLASDVVLLTPQSEVDAAIVYLDKHVEPENQSYIKFLSTYAIPEKDRNNAVLTATFLLHSLVGPTKDIDNFAGSAYPLAKMEDILDENGKVIGQKFVPYRLVPGSKTLWHLDLRDYNFTEESWENAAKLDGYFVAPVINPASYGALRLLSGNAVLRMDWFITHVSDMTKQLDTDSEPFLYFNFLFAQVEQPKTIQEFESYFAFDRQRSRKIGNESGALVTKSKQVSRHNRMLFGYRTEFGYWYTTYDTKSQEGFRDYFESFLKNPKVGTPPPIYDAGEVFGSNIFGLQVYGLHDGEDKIITDGATQVVRHLTDVVGDTRVRLAHSCIDCHAAGPLPSENTIREFLKDDDKTVSYFKSKEDYNRTKRTFLSDKFEASIVLNQQLFADAMKVCNGLEPEENGVIYRNIIRWYERPVTLEQAALECGVIPEEFKKKVFEVKFGNRLKLLANTGEPIPRDIWESRGKDGTPGQFQQAMIAIHGLTQIDEKDTQIIEQNVVKPVVNVNGHYVLTQDHWLMLGPQRIIMVPNGTTIERLNVNGDWIYTQFNGRQGYLPLSVLKIVE